MKRIEWITKSMTIVVCGVGAIVAIAAHPQEVPQEINRSTFRALLSVPRGASQPIPPPPTVTLVNVELSDDGDNDGWADTHEAVSMTITLRNRMGVALTGLVARLVTEDPNIACMSTDRILIADMQDGEIRRSSSAFEFVMGDFERVDPAQELTATLEVEIAANELVPPFPRYTIRLDLDLDVSGGSGPTVWHEGFESGLGSFAPMHIDETLNPPDSDPLNSEAGLQNADGYRCQYSDPDWEESFSFGESSGQHCYPNPEGAPDAFYFHVTDDRSFSESRSLHFGIELEPSLGFTTPTAQLEAVRTVTPIALEWQRRCSVSQSAPCVSNMDCPVDEFCVLPLPELVFKHQVSFVDHRMLNTHGQPRSLDRGIVQGQLADDAGNPLGPWIKLKPHINAYDTEPDPAFSNCKFDPVDDGNTEEDFFDPADPSRLFGPSSTCFPERGFVDQGETGDAFNGANIGDAPDGPGLEGAAGIGTWVESRVDLSRFRGRRLRLRFLVSQIKLVSIPDWESAFGENPTPLDDGWFIDDVQVTRTLLNAAVVTVDSKPNDDLVEQHDSDADSVLTDCDCGPGNSGVWSLPTEVRDLRLSHVGGASGQTLITWSPPDDLGGTEVSYDVLVSALASDFGGAQSACIDDPDRFDLVAVDGAEMPGGGILHLLVRAVNACGDGGLGEDSIGAARVSAACPGE